MKKLILLLLFLSLNCLSQETILDCKGKGQKELKGEVVSTYSREFVLYFDEQKNIVHLSELTTMCDAMKVLSNSKFSEKHKIDKKKIEYYCEVSYYLSGHNEKHSDTISINRVTGEFKTYGVLNTDKITDISLHTSNGTCKKTSNQF
jgi:hypothetical protein